jgi:tetratricopeptide (TPR) repeat protein
LLEPENTEYLLILGECEYRLGKIDDAEEVYKKLLEIDPTMMEAWLDASYIKFTKGEFEEAVELLKEAIKTDPDCHQYYYRLVCYLYELGLIKRSTVEFRNSFTPKQE